MAATPGYRLYRDLASWWPLISPVSEYAAEAAYLREVLRTAAIPVRDVLDLGSGGGHMAAHLKGWFTLALVDISPEMLATSRRLNPECAHQRGDMRAVRLGRTFDAVLAHDAVDYVTSQDDLRRVIATAWAHCRPGGLAVFVPDHTAESFRPGHGGGGSTGPDGRAGSFREWRSDPDPADEVVEVRYEFVLREPRGAARVVREAHRLGAFRRDTWLRLLRAAGFEPADGRAGVYPRGEPGRPANLFVGHRPGPRPWAGARA